MRILPLKNDGLRRPGDTRGNPESLQGRDDADSPSREAAYSGASFVGPVEQWWYFHEQVRRTAAWHVPAESFAMQRWLLPEDLTD